VKQEKILMWKALCLLACLLSLPAALAEEIAEYQQTQLGLYLAPLEAQKMKRELGEGMAFIDVRTRAELGFVGVPSPIDANIPFLLVDFEGWNEDKDFFQMAPNDQFLSSVERLLADMNLDKNSPIMVMCRSGHRGAAASNLLAEAGYTRVYNLLDGFEGVKAEAGPQAGQRVINGWKNSGADWTNKIDQDKLY
jgi:rhodanese-related sulfurtransferase